MTGPTYSIVIPVCNEAEGLGALYERLVGVLARLDADAEVLLVDDGSVDDSWELMVALHERDGRFKTVRLSRNFGHQSAITAGMDLAVGEAVVVMDADLQDPPEVIVEMAARWRDGWDVVYGVRADRSTDSRFKRTTAAAFYRLQRRLTDVDMPLDAGDFRLVDRRVLQAVSAMREGSRYVRGMVASVGFSQVAVAYRREARFAGETKYPLRRMVRLAADGIIGFSHLPLRLALQTGLVVSALSLVGGLVALLMKFTGAASVTGWTSLIFVVCLLGGVQLAVMGLIGEYLGRTYDESLHRPLYIVSDQTGLSEAAMAAPTRAVIAVPRRPRPGPFDLDALASGYLADPAWPRPDPDPTPLVSAPADRKEPK